MGDTLNFNDIIKKSIYKLEMFGKVSSYDVVFGLLMALILGLFIFYIYKVTFKGVVYNYNYNISLVLMCLITSLVIMTISSNVVLSLGMVGALSIVRYRTAIKEPMDIVYMFWAIAVGITTGAGIFPIAIIGSIFTGVVVLVLSKFRVKDATYILIIHYSQTANDEVKQRLSKIKYTMKSKTVSKGNVELNVEVKIKDDNTTIVNEISEIEGVSDAILVGYNGEYAS